MSTPSLAERLEALTRALELSHGHFAPERLAAAHAVVAKTRERVGHGTDHTVVALAGSTGVGKSSLFNALVGTDISDVSVRRPTTGVAHAAIYGEGGEALLDWLDVGRRHHVAQNVDDRSRQGLVLLDLPDFDSTEASNRAEVDRLVALVDAMIWVTDPQKYADEMFHDGYVRPLAGHAEVLSFVVNKIDAVAPAERDLLLADFTSRLRDDGIADPQVRVTSATSAHGVGEVATLIDETIEHRRAVVDRLVSDLRDAADALSTGGRSAGVTESDRRELVARLGHAAGADQAGEIVAAQHRKDARMAMGWPPLKLAERFRRRHPISELPRASASPVARSEIDLALRDVAESAAEGLDAPWPVAMRRVAAARGDDRNRQVICHIGSTAR